MGDIEQEIDDAKVEGWELKRREGDRAIMIRRRKGSLVAHIILFIFFGWWTLGLANIAYLLYKYFADVDRRVIRVDDSDDAD